MNDGHLTWVDTQNLNHVLSRILRDTNNVVRPSRGGGLETSRGVMVRHEFRKSFMNHVVYGYDNLT